MSAASPNECRSDVDQPATRSGLVIDYRLRRCVWADPRSPVDAAKEACEQRITHAVSLGIPRGKFTAEWSMLGKQTLCQLSYSRSGGPDLSKPRNRSGLSVALG